MRLAHASSPSPWRAPARCRRIVAPASSSGSSAARSSSSAGHDLERRARHSPEAARREGLPEARIERHAGFRAASSAMTAAAVSSIERRVTSMIGQACRAQSFRLQAISSVTQVAVDIGIGELVGLHGEHAMLADLHDAVGARDQPDDQRLSRRQQLGGQRRALHQRKVRGLDPAIGEIDRGRRLRRAAHADQHHIRLVDRLDMLAVVMRERKVQRLDAAEIFGVEDVLRADPAFRARAEIGLERRQHRIEDREAGHAELSAAVLQDRRERGIDQRVEHDPRRLLDLAAAPARPAPACAPPNGCARSHGCACTAPPPRGRRRPASRRSRRRRDADGNTAVSPRARILWRIFDVAGSAAGFLPLARYRFLEKASTALARCGQLAADIRAAVDRLLSSTAARLDRWQPVCGNALRIARILIAVRRYPTSYHIAISADPQRASNGAGLWTSDNPSNPPPNNRRRQIHQESY